MRMTLGEIVTIIITLVVGLPAIHWARAEVGEFREQNRLTRLDLQNRGIEVAAQMQPADARRLPWRLYLPMLATGFFMVATWIAVGVNYYDRRHYAAPVIAAKTDARLAPFADKSSFFTGLPSNSNEIIDLCCFIFEPGSCPLALKYRNRFADYFTPGPMCFSYSSDGADFKGVSIVTLSESRTDEAKAIRRQFRQGLQAEPLERLNPKLRPNEVQVWIGGEL
jgi:hypothetical protein